MSFEFKLPDIGEGVVEGEIVSWLVAEGDVVAEDQPLVEVLTDKATVVIPSPKAGRVSSLPWKVGDSVGVGKTLVVLDIGGAAAAKAPKPPASTPPAKAPSPAAAPPAGASSAAAPPAASPPAARTPRPPPRTQPLPVVSEVPPDDDVYGESDGAMSEMIDDTPPTPDDVSSPGQILASPSTRRLAREMGVSLARVAGSGRQGRVTRDDIERAAQRKATSSQLLPARGLTAPSPRVPPPPSRFSQLVPAPPPAPPAARAPVTPPPAATPAPTPDRLKLKGIRKAQAEGMVRSFYTAPHFTYVEEIDMTELVALRKTLKGPAAARGAELTFLPFIMKALVTTLREHPFLNASLDDAAQEIVFHKTFHMGIAVATEHGLTVPVVYDVNAKSVVQLATELADKSDRARRLKLTKDDFGGSTFTITSLGKIGGVLATPIINPGEVAILGIHAMRIAPKWDEAKAAFVPREMMNVSLSFDHRVVDGFTGATAVQRLKQLLEAPSTLFLDLA